MVRGENPIRHHVRRKVRHGVMVNPAPHTKFRTLPSKYFLNCRIHVPSTSRSTTRLADPSSRRVRNDLVCDPLQCHVRRFLDDGAQHVPVRFEVVHLPPIFFGATPPSSPCALELIAVEGQTMKRSAAPRGHALDLNRLDDPATQIHHVTLPCGSPPQTRGRVNQEIQFLGPRPIKCLAS